MSFCPCIFTWDSATLSMRLAPRFRRVAEEQFRDGEEYRLTEETLRSNKQHAHYFASVNQAWKNLRGETAEILTSPTLLRGWALVETGWHDQHVIEAPDRDTAIRIAVFARAVASKETYSEVKVIQHDGSWYVRIRTPRSQSRASMNAEDFKESSRAVLDILSGAIEVTRKQLSDAAKRDAT